MATAIETPPALQADDRFVLRHLDWNAYDAIRRALENHPTRLAYDGKDLEQFMETIRRSGAVE